MVIVMAVVTVRIMASVVVRVHWLRLWLTDLWRADYDGSRLLDDSPER
jgi:hypothetical protein